MVTYSYCRADDCRDDQPRFHPGCIKRPEMIVVFIYAAHDKKRR